MKFQLANDHLTVELEGWERIWSLRRRLVISRANITHAAWHAEPMRIGVWLRMAGTSLPGVLAAGTFLSQGMKQFLYLRRPRGLWRPSAANVLTLDLQGMFYGRVVLSCAEADAARVIQWARAGVLNATK